MWNNVHTDDALREHIRKVWSGIFPMFRPLPPELLAKLRGDIVADVEAIRARGGDVIFIRCPSTGAFRAIERETAPREQCWDPLIAETGCLGIHFEDHPELQGFECPEWSHLDGPDATRFSTALAAIIKREYKGRGVRHD
jgi:hypothetical protein